METTTQEKLEYLKETKAAVRAAIAARGVPVSDTDTFRSYADKIAAIGSGEQDILPLTTLEGFVFDGYQSVLQTAADYTLTIGQTYYVVWDGVTYACVGQDAGMVVPGAVGLGDFGGFGGTGSDEPFTLGVAEGVAMYVTTDDSASHTVRIYRALPDPGNDVRYVTFLSHDGRQFYGRKPVAVGDDCADPIARGIFATPIRETTDKNTYTFVGWSTTPGGSLDSSALKAVTADRTLYARFSAAIRYYTVTYYDEDGTTVLTTERLPYGVMPTYEPKKMGYTFDGWTPALAAVTGDAAYQAAWLQKMDFNALTWAQIAAYCQSEDVSQLFDIGATKTFTYNEGSSVNYTATAEIIGFYHDDLADGSGKAPITLRLRGFLPEPRYWHSEGLPSRLIVTWGKSEVRTIIGYYDGDPYGLKSDFVAVTKKVAKPYYDTEAKAYATSEDLLFLPSMTELGFDIEGRAEGSCYQAFTTGKQYGGTYEELIFRNRNAEALEYWTRTKYSDGNVYAITDEGGTTYGTQGNSSRYAACVCVCIG